MSPKLSNIEKYTILGICKITHGEYTYNCTTHMDISSPAGVWILLTNFVCPENFPYPQKRRVWIGRRRLEPDRLIEVMCHECNKIVHVNVGDILKKVNLGEILMAGVSTKEYVF